MVCTWRSCVGDGARVKNQLRDVLLVLLLVIVPLEHVGRDEDALCVLLPILSNFGIHIAEIH